MADENWSQKYLDDLNRKLAQKNNGQDSKPPSNQNRQERDARGRRRNRNRRRRERPERQPAPPPPRTQTVSGLVIAVGEKFAVQSGNQRYECRAGRGIERSQVYVGDRVQIAAKEPVGFIEKIEPRQNLAIRPFRKNEQEETILATNVNQIVIVVSIAEPVMRTDWLDRHLLICEKKGYKPTLCCTKTDLANDNSFIEQLDTYRRMGYRVIYTSLHVEPSLSDLRNMLRGKITLFTGPAGSGKTSLIQSMTETHRVAMATTDEPEAVEMDEEYRPTESVSAHRLDPNSWLIDTPGITEFEISGISKNDLKKYYRDFRRIQEPCESPYCLHQDEPRCAVRAAAERGELADDRYQNYLKILEQFA
jgi:ribosome biogenesis GTPase